jgi:hypothetical protein
LKRKENALVLSHGSIVGQKIDWTDLATKVIENKMSDRRFAVAPMMDWTGTSQKVKRDQHLSTVVAGHVVPNAVPSD